MAKTKQETTVLKFEDYVEKASRLYNLALEGKVSKVRISVRKRWCRCIWSITRRKTILSGLASMTSLARSTLTSATPTRMSGSDLRGIWNN